MDDVSRALRFASVAHDGQTDKQGKPYIDHPVSVAAALRPYGTHVQIVALLHDVCEDTPVTFAQVAGAFGLEVAEAVLTLTRQPGETYTAYIDRVSHHRVARVVKMADIRHNLSRMIPELAGLEARYEAALVVLERAHAHDPLLIDGVRDGADVTDAGSGG